MRKIRPFLVAVAMACLPVLADASPAVVRVIWKVGTDTACAKRYDAQSREKWPGQVDPTPDDGKCPDGFETVTNKGSLIRPGDVVHVYAVHYNPVSFKPLNPDVATATPDVPDVVRILRALFQVVAGPTPLKVTADPGAPDVRSANCPEATFDGLSACLGDGQSALGELQRLVLGFWTGDRVERAFKLARFVDTMPSVLSEKAQPAYSLDQELDKDVPGARTDVCEYFGGNNSIAVDCRGTRNPATFPSSLLPAMNRLGLALALFDANARAVCDETNRETKCVELRDQRRALTDSVGTSLGISYVGGTWEPEKGGLWWQLAQYERALAAVGRARFLLSTQGVRAHRVAMPPQGPVGARARLLFTLPLQRVDDDLDIRPETLELVVEPARPRLVLSAGLLAAAKSDLGVLALRQTPTESGVQASLEVIDDPAVRPVMPLLLTGIRLTGAFYVSVGTLADKNAFKSAAVGASWYHDRWKMMFTAGFLGIRGTTDRDLAPLIVQYSSNGAILPGVVVANLPVEARWHKSAFLGVTFTPF